MKTVLPLTFAFLTAFSHAATPARVVVQPSKLRQTYQGLGCGAMLYEGHITSLAARGKDDRQRQLYDDMFAKVNARYLHLGIRATHEPQNDNDDPWTPAFDPANFKYCAHLLAIVKAARERRPNVELVATLGTPPPWMKTNNAESGGGKEKATLKPKLELEFAEYLWAFLAHMARNGAPVKYLAISNECDWAHDQAGCFFTPDAHAKLFEIVGDYLDKMAVKFPDVPRALLMGPNTLSAPAAVSGYIPAMMRKAGKHVAVFTAHDYDMRGDRWGDMQRLARGTKPVWMTEWCARGEDDTPGQIKSAIDYASAMQAGFSGGVTAWMAYDWVYPNRKAGESLIHVEWGDYYALKKPYWVFRQWGEPLTPGMRIIESASTQETVKASAFLSAERTLVVHVVNSGTQEAPLQLNIGGNAAPASPATRHRTSTTEDSAALEPLQPAGSGFTDTLPAQSLTTYQFTIR